jgi:hypothetical protein
MVPPALLPHILFMKAFAATLLRANHLNTIPLVLRNRLHDIASSHHDVSRRSSPTLEFKAGQRFSITLAGKAVINVH